MSDSVMGTSNDPRTLHNYAYAFNNPVNYADPSGQMPFTLQQRQQRQNQNLAMWGLQNNYATHADTQMSYIDAAVGQGGFNTAYLGRAAQPDGMAAPRAAMGQAGQNWQPFSDPEPRQQSQGKRPKPCGFTDVLFGFGNSALNEVLEVQGFPTSGIYIHGSATHSQSPGDIDIMIRLSDEEFNALAEEFMESAYHSDRRVDISKGIEKGKLASYYAGTRPTIVQSIHDHLEGDLPKLQVSFIREESTFDLGPVFPINE